MPSAMASAPDGEMEEKFRLPRHGTTSHTESSMDEREISHGIDLMGQFSKSLVRHGNDKKNKKSNNTSLETSMDSRIMSMDSRIMALEKQMSQRSATETALKLQVSQLEARRSEDAQEPAHPSVSPMRKKMLEQQMWQRVQTETALNVKVCQVEARFRELEASNATFLAAAEAKFLQLEACCRELEASHETRHSAAAAERNSLQTTLSELETRFLQAFNGGQGDVAERALPFTARGISEEPLLEETAALCQSNDFEESEERLVPHSYFSYHMLLFTLKPDFWNPSCWKLILLVLLQHLFVVGLAEASLVELLNDYVSSGRKEWATWDACFYEKRDVFSFLFPFENKLLFGKPFPNFLLAVATMILVILQMSQCDEGLHTVYYNPAMSQAARWFVNYVWFFEGVFIPAVFCGSLSVMLASSEGGMDIVMIGLSTQFILEIDNAVYERLVDRQSKLEYKRLQQHHLHHDETLRMAEQHLNVLQVLKFVMSTMLYVWIFFGNFPSYLLNAANAEPITANWVWNTLICVAPICTSFGIHGAMMSAGSAKGERSGADTLCGGFVDFAFYAGMGGIYYATVAHAWLGPAWSGMQQCTLGLFEKF